MPPPICSIGGGTDAMWGRTVAYADLILVTDSGRLTEYGSRAELLERGGQYATLYGNSAASYAGSV